MIELEAELKTVAAPALTTALSEAPEGDSITVDGAAVVFLGGSCLQALAAAARGRPGGLVIARPSPELIADLATLGATDLFRIEGDPA